MNLSLFWLVFLELVAITEIVLMIVAIHFSLKLLRDLKAPAVTVHQPAVVQPTSVCTCVCLAYKPIL